MLLVTPGSSSSSAVLSVRLQIPWTGAWVADCALSEAAPLPTGKCTLAIGQTTLVGTIDPRGTGLLGETKRVRVVGGAGAWGNIVQRVHLHSDSAPITSTLALQQISQSIGETVVDPNPVTYGTDWMFLTGPAAGALEGRQWYVDANGITQIQPWPTLQPGADVDVLHWDPETRRAELSCDEIVWPGTTITDARFGTIVARDIDQIFRMGEGSRVTLWHSSAVESRFDSMLFKVAALGGQQWLKVYRYRISTQDSDGRVRLQAVDPAQGQPDTLPLSVWPGMAGLSAKYTLGQLCSVAFLEGNKSLPRVISFDGQPPVELDLTATSKLKAIAGAELDVDAPLVKVGANATNGGARKGDAVNCGYLVFKGANGLNLDSYYPGTAAGLAAANARVTALGGPPANVFALNDGNANADAAVGGQITTASSKVKVE